MVQAVKLVKTPGLWRSLCLSAVRSRRHQVVHFCLDNMEDAQAAQAARCATLERRQSSENPICYSQAASTMLRAGFCMLILSTSVLCLQSWTATLWSFLSVRLGCCVDCMAGPVRLSDSMPGEQARPDNMAIMLQSICSTVAAILDCRLLL